MKANVLATAALLACSGCDNAHGIFPVSGKVTYKGDPAVGALVFFQRRGGDCSREQTMMAVVGPDGSFSLDCGSLGKGAPPGEYIVLVQWKCDPRPPFTPDPRRRQRAPPKPGKGRLCRPQMPPPARRSRAETERLALV